MDAENLEIAKSMWVGHVGGGPENEAQHGVALKSILRGRGQPKVHHPTHSQSTLMDHRKSTNYTINQNAHNIVISMPFYHTMTLPAGMHG